MKNIEQRTVVHGVECCAQIKQDECSNFATIHRTNVIIHETHYSSLRVMMSAICRLIRWKQSVTFSMCSEPRRNNPFNELRGVVGRLVTKMCAFVLLFVLINRVKMMLDTKQTMNILK